MQYHKDLLDRVDTLPLPPWPDGHKVRTETWRWDWGGPGRAFADWCFGSDEVYYYEWWEASWDQTGEGWAFWEQTRRRACGEREYGEGIPYRASERWDGEKCAVEAWRREADSGGGWGIRMHQRRALTRYELRTGGKAPAGRRNLFVLEGWALGVGNPFWPEVDYAEPRFYEIRPEQVVLGELGHWGVIGGFTRCCPTGRATT